MDPNDFNMNAFDEQTSEDNVLDELFAMFGQEDEVTKMQNEVLTQNLEGFASCFPDWDIHPPVK